jgi:hypothetical protein
MTQVREDDLVNCLLPSFVLGDTLDKSRRPQPGHQGTTTDLRRIRIN